MQLMIDVLSDHRSPPYMYLYDIVCIYECARDMKSVYYLTIAGYSCFHLPNMGTEPYLQTWRGGGGVDNNILASIHHLT